MDDADDLPRSIRAPVAAHGPRRWPTPIAERMVRQVQGNDAWNFALRLRERHLPTTAGLARADLARRLDVLRSTQAAVVDRTALRLEHDRGPMTAAGPTAAVVHRCRWFVDEVCDLLAADGFEIVARTDDGATALGVIVAEQPDLVLVGGRLVRMTAVDLLAEATLFSPQSVLLAHVDDAGGRALRAAGVEAAVLARPSPVDAAEAVAHLLASPRAAGPLS